MPGRLARRDQGGDGPRRPAGVRGRGRRPADRPGGRRVRRGPARPDRYGATVVAEAAFQDAVWRTILEPLASRAQLRIVQCHVDPAAARGRRRSAIDVGGRRAHAAIIGAELEDWERALSAFARLSLPAPALDVDTTAGYEPPLPQIVAFAAARR